MKTISIDEKIARIEMAPEEVQTMVAKAFLRDDIDDEDIQYTFNEDPIDVLCEEGAIENVEICDENFETEEE